MWLLMLVVLNGSEVVKEYVYHVQYQTKELCEQEIPKQKVSLAADNPGYTYGTDYMFECRLNKKAQV